MAIRAKNSFNSGDLITMLPGLQKLYFETGKRSAIYQRLNMPSYYYDDAIHPVRDEKGVQVCMNEHTFKMMKPLLEAQQYIEKYEVWAGEDDLHFDFDLTRFSTQSPLPNGSIHAWAYLIFPQLQCDLSIPWINVPTDEKYKNQIIINRTTRYNIPYVDYFFLKDYQNIVTFAGTKEEHQVFTQAFNLNIPLLIVNDFLELAIAINSCRFFMGNQSMCFHISDAIKKERILEVCSQYPNSFSTGANGYDFITQSGLEYNFDLLINKTK